MADCIVAQKSAVWHESRNMRITGSRVGAILGLSPWQKPDAVIREMVRAVMKMLFQVSAPELTPEVIEDKNARQTLESLTSLADEGKIDEAENRLYEMTCDGDRQNLEIGLLFYYELNGKDDEFLEANNFSREEIMMGIQDLADRYNLSGIAEAFRTEIL